jgi:hypothetical protein
MFRGVSGSDQCRPEKYLKRSWKIYCALTKVILAFQKARTCEGGNKIMRYKMLMFYAQGMPDETAYDGIRDYCLCEKINEEYLRTLIQGKKIKNILTTIKIKFERGFDLIYRGRLHY